jgi:hypothetical protein
MHNDNDNNSEIGSKKCWFCCCCLYGTACLPINLTWFLLGPLFLLYDTPNIFLPKQLEIGERACFPFDHAAKKNISCCNNDTSQAVTHDLTGFAVCAPYFWMHFFYEEIKSKPHLHHPMRRSRSSQRVVPVPTAPHFENPMGVPEETKIQPCER